MEVLIGKEYILNITKDISEEKIDYLGKTIALRYYKWAEISGKRVHIKSKLRSLVDYYEVYLVNDVNNVFFVSKRMLAAVPQLFAKCSCSSRGLFISGCRCGAFQKEKLGC